MRIRVLHESLRACTSALAATQEARSTLNQNMPNYHMNYNSVKESPPGINTCLYQVVETSIPDRKVSHKHSA